MATDGAAQPTINLNDFSVEVAELLTNNGADTAGVLSAFADVMRTDGLNMKEAQGMDALADLLQEEA